ncbi:MAG: DNA polymerase III subunit delta [Eubacteriales bacterium]|nr:DNA polymerase III subunit delta [Eubacteriales bacterium]
MKVIRDDIRNQTFKSVYLLYGEETYLRRQYRENLYKALVPDGDTLNAARFEGKQADVRQIIDLCETMPFLAERRVIFLDDTGFCKNKCDELADYVKELPDYLCLVLNEEQVDKRNRLYKAIKSVGYVAEFTKLDEKKLMEWAAVMLGKNGRNISRKNAELLISKTGDDMGNLRNEVEKLIMYTEGRNVVTEKDIEEICITQTKNKVFDMVRAVAEQNQKKALMLYDDLLALKEPPMRILFLLSKQFRQMLETKQMAYSGMSEREIASALGVQPFVVRGLSSCAKKFTGEELMNATEDFAEAEEAVKTGRLGDVLSVELLIIKYSAHK